MTKLFKPYARKTVTQFNKVRKNNTSLFDSIQIAYVDLYENPEDKKKLDWREYKLAVERVCDKSTLNKIVRICRNNIVMSNLDKLPLSWATLSKVVVAIEDKDSGAERTTTLLDKISEEEITASSTAKEIIDLLIPPVENQDAVSTEPVVKFDSSNYSDEELEKLNEAIDVLESLGFTIEDKATESVESDDVEDAASEKEAA